MVRYITNFDNKSNSNFKEDIFLLGWLKLNLALLLDQLRLALGD